MIKLMIIKEFFYEIILLGTFFGVAVLGVILPKQTMKVDMRNKPYWMMNKKELDQLEFEVDNNLDDRATLINRFELLTSQDLVSKGNVDYIKSLLLSDIKGYKGSRNAYAVINNCLKDEYVSNENLGIINNILDLESKSFFNSHKPVGRNRKEKAKVIELNFNK